MMLTFVFIIIFILSSSAQSVQTWSAPGTYSWVCPPGVTTVKVDVWGGGGAGGGAASVLGTSVGAGGGGGGCATSLLVAVTPGTTYSVVVGAGGAGLVNGTGADGAASSFSAGGIIAQGGKGGRVDAATGAGGSATFTGGAGSTGLAGTYSGAGGGAGGTTAIGLPALLSVGGVGGLLGGGSGANGRTNNGNGVAGNAPGGGGSGGYSNFFNGAKSGGAGGAGQVTLTYLIPPLCGTYRIGAANGILLNTLTAALNLVSVAGISCPIVFEIEDAVLSAEIFPIVLRPYLGSSAVNTITIRPAPGVAVDFTAALNNNLFVFDGCKNFIIDGLNTGGATLKFENTSIGNAATTINFINGAQNNVLRNANIFGAGTGADLGTVYFGQGMAGAGNANNLISNCNIGPSGANTPRNAIVSNGNTAAASGNTNNSITNNNIYDFFSATSDCYGIRMNTATSGWLINGNNFFLTSPKNITTLYADYTPIALTNTASGENTRIQNNYIGGSAAFAGGAAMTITGSGSFKGILIRGIAGTPNVISNNRFQNIQFSNDNSDLNTFIFHSDGNANITGNTIGSQTANGNIRYTSSYPRTIVGGVAKAGSLSAIFAGGAVGEPTVFSGEVNIQNNTMGGINIVRSGSGDAEFRGIDVENNYCNFNVSSNIIGGTTVNSISNNTSNNLLGIFAAVGTGGFTHQLVGNTIRNLSSTTTEQYGFTAGLFAQGGAVTTYNIQDNFVSDLVATSFNPGYFTLVGIRNASTAAGQKMFGNAVNNLVQNNTGVVASVGIYCSGTSAGIAEINRNTVTALTTPFSTGSSVAGIDFSAAGGTVKVFNNMVVLGYHNNTSSFTNSTNMSGIRDRSSSGSTDIVFNSVHIGGSGVTAGTQATYGLKSLASAGVNRLVANNNIVNDRAAGTTDKNCAIGIDHIAGVNSQSNNLYVPLVAGNYVGILAGTPAATLNEWKLATSMDTASLSYPATFVNPVTDLQLIESPSQANFLLANEGLALPGYTTDFFGNTRNTLTPDLGFHEFRCRGCWTGTASSRWEVSSIGPFVNWEDQFVPDANTHTKISSSLYQPVIHANVVGQCKDLHLTYPGFITVDDGTLDVSGNIKLRSGLVDAQNGTLQMSGVLNQLIPASLLVANSVKNLSIANTDAVSGVELGGPLSVYRALTFTPAGKIFDTHDYLTMKSTATETAWIGNLTGKDFKGKATIERHLFARKAWRFLATPVTPAGSQTIMESWQENRSAAANGFGTMVTGPNIFGQDEFTIRASVKSYDAATNNFTEITSTAIPISNARGYFVFVRGDRGVTTTGGTTNATNLRIKGNINTGDQTVNVPAQKFQSFGNPYASAVNFKTVSKTNLANAYIAWNPSAAGLYGLGAYETYTWDGANYRQVPGGAIRNNIQSGEAVFVLNNSTNTGALTIRESDKTSGSALVSRGANDVVRQEEFPMLEGNLYVKTADAVKVLGDGFLVRFADDYANGIDNEDVLKLSNAVNNFGVQTEDKTLVMASRKLPAVNDTINLFISKLDSRPLLAAISLKNFVNADHDFYFGDRYLKTEKLIAEYDTTWIDFSISQTAASYASNRFYLLAKKTLRKPLQFTKVEIEKPQSGKVKLHWEVLQQYAVTKYECQASVNGGSWNTIGTMQNNLQNAEVAAHVSPLTEQPAGKIAYRIKAVQLGNKIVFSDTVMTGNSTTKQVSIFPNPIMHKTAQMHFSAAEKGMYSITVYNASATKIFDQKVSVNTIVSDEILQLPPATAPGNYMFVITSPSGQKETLTAVVQ